MEFIFVSIGAVIGAIVFAIIRLVFVTDGTLRIDHSDPEKDVYRLEIDNLEKLAKKSRLELKIDHDAHLSQE